MWNKISEADFLRYFGIAREGFDGLRLVKMAEKVPDKRAEQALNFLIRKGMDLRFGPNPKKHLTKAMVLFQMKVYFALLELKRLFGLDFMGVQDQLDWIEHYPTTDLTLGILNNRLRPEPDSETVVAATEADDGAALTMQLLKLLSGGQPVGFNDLRYRERGSTGSSTPAPWLLSLRMGETTL
jgi:L-fucose isomerase